MSDLAGNPEDQFSHIAAHLFSISSNFFQLNSTEHKINFLILRMFAANIHGDPTVNRDY